MQKFFSRIILAFIVTSAMLSAFSCSNRKRESDSSSENAELRDSLPPYGFWEEDYIRHEGKVANGDNFSGLLNRLGMDSESAYRLVQCCDSIFDVRKMRAGNSWTAYYDSLSNRLEYLVYNNSRTQRTIFRCGDSLSVSSYYLPVEHIRRYADVTISSSLWNDMSKAGSSPMLIMSLSDIYAWTVDFFGLQKNDRFRVIYGQEECEGKLLGIDTIYFACFTRDSSNLYAVMYDQGDGGNIYWNEKGESMRKAFLKAPLEFKRISSGFSYSRKHPVTGQYKAHTGVDYAAPSGTPVVALGDGTVQSAGWTSGGGNTVKIRHNSVYTTGYLHLSKFASGIKAGARVSQGQVIGYVGSTGVSTGPHLDFRVWMNGSPINPLKLESPAAEPIKQEFMPALDSMFNVYFRQMEEYEANLPEYGSEQE